MLGVLRSACRPGFAPLRAARTVTTPLTSSRFLVRTVVTKRYTKEHEMVTYDSDTNMATVTLTTYAQKTLGDVVFVELISVGENVKQGAEIGTVESVKSAADIYAPVSGTIDCVNLDLDQQPGLINKSPEEDGWLVRILVEDAKELEGLMKQAEYKAWCQE